MQLLNPFGLPELECSNDVYARNFYTEFEMYEKSLADFIDIHTDKSRKGSVDYTAYNAFKKDIIGYTKEAQNLYSKQNMLIYFIFYLKIMFYDKKITEMYSECNDRCEDDVFRDKELDKYCIDKVLKKMKCMFPYEEMRSLLKRLGWNLEDKIVTNRIGINFMCINDDSVQYFNCSCNDSIFTVS
jgi:hypothetical protein